MIPVSHNMVPGMLRDVGARVVVTDNPILGSVAIMQCGPASLKCRRRLECQGVELLGCRRGLIFDVAKLTFTNHMHRFNTSDDNSGTAKGLKAEHWSGDAFDGSVVLFDNIIEIL